MVWLLRFEWKVPGALVSPEEISWLPSYPMALTVPFTLVDAPVSDLALPCRLTHQILSDMQCEQFLREESCYPWGQEVFLFFSFFHFKTLFLVSTHIKIILISPFRNAGRSTILVHRMLDCFFEAESQTLTFSEAINSGEIIQCPRSWGQTACISNENLMITDCQWVSRWLTCLSRMPD